MERDERDEEAQRISWRYEQARKLGLERREASEFARGDGDLGELRRLIEEKGCDPAVAARIAS